MACAWPVFIAKQKMDLLERDGNPIISTLNDILEMEKIYIKPQVIIMSIILHNIFTIVANE